MDEDQRECIHRGVEIGVEKTSRKEFGFSPGHILLESGFETFPRQSFQRSCLPMNSTAKLTITTGPDRGRAFELQGEMVHIGRGADNEVILADPTLDDHHASIVHRNGRYAIYSPRSMDIAVDGTNIPSERWVWLPAKATIQLTRRTALEFDAPEPPEEDEEPAPVPATQSASIPARRSREFAAREAAPTPTTRRADGPPPIPGAKAGKRPAVQRPAKATGNVARFITDQQGDPLVKLGEDGHLPELALDEGDAKEKRTPKEAGQKSNPLVMVLAFLVSVGFSVLALFVDIDQVGGDAQQKSVARRAIAIFYGSDKAPLEPYQTLLRRARQEYTQGNLTQERELYREVIRMLLSEKKNPFTGLTMLTPEDEKKFQLLTFEETDLLSRDDTFRAAKVANFLDLKNDEKLERLLAILLGDG